MEIIARLREERQALVDRVNQIDKMLQQYEVWGREAQRLLSLTQVPQSSHAKESEVVMNKSDAESAHQTSSPRIGGGIIRRGTFLTATPKTPIKEFEVAVIDVLRESNRPMDRVALYDSLTARGIVIGDGDRDKELNALSARVYRMAQDGDIISQRGQGYRLNSGGADSDKGEQHHSPVSERDDSDLI